MIAVDDHCGEHLSPRTRDIESTTRDCAAFAARALELGLDQHEAQSYPFGRSASRCEPARDTASTRSVGMPHIRAYAPWTHSLIDFNGLVYVCCMTREQIPPLGDLKQASFREIWTGAGYQAIRQMMHPPALKPCRRCDDFLEENKQLLEIVERR